MARRASSSVPPFWIALIFVVLVLSGAGGFFLYRVVGDPFRTIPALDVDAYLENANSLRGNVYKIDATVAHHLSGSASAGRLVSVETGGNMLPVLIPPDLNYVKIEPGQRFHLSIEVIEKGILRVRQVRKV
jgi:hypothetical protein